MHRFETVIKQAKLEKINLIDPILFDRLSPHAVGGWTDGWSLMLVEDEWQIVAEHATINTEIVFYAVKFSSIKTVRFSQCNFLSCVISAAFNAILLN